MNSLGISFVYSVPVICSRKVYSSVITILYQNHISALMDKKWLLWARLFWLPAVLPFRHSDLYTPLDHSLPNSRSEYRCDALPSTNHPEDK
jgi:hypothetical protein